MRRKAAVPVLLGALAFGACSAPDAAIDRSRPSATPAAAAGPRIVRYAEHPDGVADLYLPSEPRAIVVLLHGGFWREGFRRDLMRPIAEDLSARGFAVWNVEYRRVGASGGGFPMTFDDVAVALGTLHDERAASPTLVDLPVAYVGHSAGGHLALWAATHDFGLDPCAVVSLSGITDLATAAEDGLGGGAVQALLDGLPEERPDRYAATSPRALDPPRAAVVLVHPTSDRIVPREQSTNYEQWVNGRGGSAILIEPPGDHFALIDPDTEAWAKAVIAMSERCGTD